MPIYEYRCSECGHKFDKLILAQSTELSTLCPQCNSQGVEKLISLIGATKTSGISASSSSACMTST